MTAALPVTAAGIYQAKRRLHGVAATTPVVSSPALDHLTGRIVAALASPGLPPGPTGVVISGGSVDFATFRALMAGLSHTDRVVA